jgi:transposase
VIGLGRGVRVFAWAESVDMRKSFDTLSAVVREQVGHDVLDGAPYLFIGKNRRRAKVLFWDGTGLCVR